jgi:hypothetical protein
MNPVEAEMSAQCVHGHLTRDRYLGPMPRFVVRLWLPDRPGALGAVASRIGAVRADVVGVEILERGGGRAIDELTVELPDSALVNLLVEEIGQVDGVDVEHVRPVRGPESDRATASVAVARALAGASTGDEVLARLAEGLVPLFEADWAAIVDPAIGRVVVLRGGDDIPSAEWLAEFVIGSSAGEGSFAAVDELTRASLPASSLQVVLSRHHLPLREAERAVMSGLAEFADELVTRFGWSTAS